MAKSKRKKKLPKRAAERITERQIYSAADDFYQAQVTKLAQRVANEVWKTSKATGGTPQQIWKRAVGNAGLLTVREVKKWLYRVMHSDIPDRERAGIIAIASPSYGELTTMVLPKRVQGAYEALGTLTALAMHEDVAMEAEDILDEKWNQMELRHG